MESNTNLSAENKENEINIYSDAQSQLSRREQLELWKQSKQGTKKQAPQPQKPDYKRRSDIFIVDKESNIQNSVPSSSVQPKKEKSLPRASLQPQQINNTISNVASNPSTSSDLKKQQADKRKSIAAKPNPVSRHSIIPQEKPEAAPRFSMASISTPGRESILTSSSTPRESMSMSREERLKLWRLEKEKEKIEELQAEIAKATKGVMKKQQQFASAKKQQNTVSLRPPATPGAKTIIIQPITDMNLLRNKLDQIMNLQSADEARQQFEDLLQDPSLPEASLVAEYWVTRARFEEQQRNFAEVVRLYEQASQLFAQPITAVEDGLRAFMLRLKDSYISKFKRCAEELAEFQERTEFDANFATKLDFANPSQRNSPSSKTVTATEEQMQLIKDLVDTLSKNPLAAAEEQTAPQVVPATVAAQTDAAVNIIEQAFQAHPVEVTNQAPVTPVSKPTQPASIDSISLDKYLQIEDTPYEPEAEEDQPELMFNDPVLRILTPPRKNRKSSLAMRKSTPKPQRVLLEDEVEEVEGESQHKEVPVESEQPLASSVVVLAPVPASQKQKKALGSSKILTPVRRSTRLSTSTRMVPLNDESLSQVLEETGYAYSPNLSVQKKNKGFKVMFAENLPSQAEHEEDEEDEFAKYLRTPVSKPPQTPMSAVLASATIEREIQTSPLQFPVEHERVVQRLFTDSNEEHEMPLLEQYQQQEEEVAEEEAHHEEEYEEEIKHEEPELEFHVERRSELGRYDTLASIVKSGRKSSSKKSVRISAAEETPSRHSWHSRRKSTPCPSRVQSSSPVAVTPVRRSVRLSSAKKNKNIFDVHDPHGPVTFTPNRYIPDLASYLKPEVESLIKEKPQ